MAALAPYKLLQAYLQMKSLIGLCRDYDDNGDEGKAIARLTSLLRLRLINTSSVNQELEASSRIPHLISLGCQNCIPSCLQNCAKYGYTNSISKFLFKLVSSNYRVENQYLSVSVSVKVDEMKGRKEGTTAEQSFVWRHPRRTFEMSCRFRG